MRYRDIKLAESTAAAREICRGLKVAIERNRNNPDSRTLSMMKQQTVKFLRQFPELKGEIDACLGIPGGVDGVLDGTSVSNAFRGNGGPNGRGEIPRGTITIPGTGTEFGASSDANGSVDNGSTVSGNSDTSGAEAGGTSAALKSAAEELSRLLDKEDWGGARVHIRRNPDLQEFLDDQFMTDLDNAVQAQADAEAAEKRDADAEAQKIADEIESARVAAVQAAADEAAAKAAENEAARARSDAEAAEKEQEETFDASDWGGDKTLDQFPVAELRAAREKYYQNLERENELFFEPGDNGPPRQNIPADEQEELDRLEQERKELLSKYGYGILRVGRGSVETDVTFPGENN